MGDAPLHILLVEDNPGDVRLLRETLREIVDPTFELAHAACMADAFVRLSTQSFDLALLDLSLPDCEGMDTVRALVKKAPHLPVIVLTGTDDVALGTQAVRFGAQDYLVKNQTDHRLLFRAIRYAIERKRAEEALRQANALLEDHVIARTQELATANTDLRAQMDAYRRLEAEVARLVEDDRLRLGMELHDNICQQIAAVGMLTSTLENKLRELDSPLAATANRLVTSLRRAGDDAQALARGLLPVQVEADGLMVALEALARRTQEMNPVSCAFDCAAPVPLASNALATHLFRIAQESVHNAIKHGRARRIVIALHNQGQISLSIQDDGQGIDHKPQAAVGSGLRIMAYRARIIGAALSITPASPTGTLIRCTLPDPATPSPPSS
jgi:signal transduction histidine kinase